MSIQPLDRRTFQRMLEHINHSLGNDGRMSVRVGYLLEFNVVGTDKVIHLPVDPHEPMPRWKATQIIKQALEAFVKEGAFADHTHDSPPEDSPEPEEEEEGSSCETGCLMPAEPTHDHTEPTEDSERIEEFVVLETPAAL